MASSAHHSWHMLRAICLTLMIGLHPLSAYGAAGNEDNCGVSVKGKSGYWFAVTSEAWAEVEVTLPSGETVKMQRNVLVFDRFDYRKTDGILRFSYSDAAVAKIKADATRKYESALLRLVEIDADLAQNTARIDGLSEEVSAAMAVDEARHLERQREAEARHVEKIDSFRSRHGGLTPSQLDLERSCTTRYGEVGVRKGENGREVPVYGNIESSGCASLRSAKRSSGWEKMAAADYRLPELPVERSAVVLEYRRLEGQEVAWLREKSELRALVRDYESHHDDSDWGCTGELDISTLLASHSGYNYTGAVVLYVSFDTWVPSDLHSWEDWAGVRPSWGGYVHVGDEARFRGSFFFLRTYVSLGMGSERAALGNTGRTEIAFPDDSVFSTIQPVSVAYRMIPVGVVERIQYKRRFYVDLGLGVNFRWGAEFRIPSSSEDRVFPDEVGRWALSSLSTAECLTPYPYGSLTLGRRFFRKWGGDGLFLGLGGEVYTRPAPSLRGTVSNGDGTVVSLPEAYTLGYSGSLVFAIDL